MTLYLVGTGISEGLRSVTREGEDAIRGADAIYLERFTSPAPSDDTAEAVRGMAPDGCVITEAKRWMVEDGTRILEDAESKNVVLLSYGDPLVATTHVDLLCRAAAQKTRARVVHSSSAPVAAAGECGLHHYKFGRMATIMRNEKSMTTPYYTIYRNAIEGCHTMLLLEYDCEGTESGDGRSFFLEPPDALGGLLRTERGQRRSVVSEDTYAIVASRVGFAGTRRQRQKITAGKVSSLIAINTFGEPPHSIIIPGGLHFTESEALATLAECVDPPPAPHDTAQGAGARDPNVPARISDQMIEKYAPMIRKSIDEVSPRCAKDGVMRDILENASRYVDDAEDFAKKDGHAEVAVLSIGYADGLADALRLMKGLDAGGNRPADAAPGGGKG